MTCSKPSQVRSPPDGESAARTNSWIHQVELRLDRGGAGDRLRRMEAWCGDWQIGMRVIETIEPGTVRVAFDDPRFARAFVSHFGGVIVPIGEIENALRDDADAEDAYDRLAQQYDVED